MGEGSSYFFIWDLKVRPAAPSRALHEGGPFIVGPKPGPSWVQAGPKLGPKPGPSWEPKKSKKQIRILKIEIRVAQNVGKVSIYEKIPLRGPHLGPPAWGHCLRVR